MGLDNTGVELLAEVTLALLLFSDAVRIDITRLRARVRTPARLLGIGLPIMIGLGTALAALLFDVPGAVAALIAAILAPTDAALGEAVVTNEAVPTRVRQTLIVESGLNDGIAVPAVTVFIALAAADESFATASTWVRFGAEQIGYGILVGAIIGILGGFLVASAGKRGWMEGGYRQIAVLGIATLAFVLAGEVGGNGFIATFVAGVALGTTARTECTHIEEFTEDVAHLLATIGFIVFGAIVVGPSLDQLDWRVALYATGSLLVVRPLAVGISLLGSGLRWPTVAFFGWFGPRGLASILFGVIALEGSHGSDLGPVFVVMSWTVLLSILTHGLSAAPLARRYGVWWSTQTRAARAESHPMAQQRHRRGPLRSQ